MNDERQKQPISMSVCVPALNESGSLRSSVQDLIDTLAGRVASLEIIIVDDGSFDDTGRIADDIARAEPNVTVIHHAQPCGIGACYRDALQKAHGEYFTWFPADGENLAREFVHCLPHMRPGVIVMCYHASGDSRSFFRRMLSRAYTAIINTMFGLRVHYYNGLAVFPRKVLASQPLTSRGFFFNAENIIRAMKGSGCSIDELVYPMKGRGDGRSKAVTMRSFRDMARDMAAFIASMR